MLIHDGAQGPDHQELSIQSLVEIAKKEKLAAISANVLAENREVLKLASRMGFSVQTTPDPMIVHTEVKLN